MTLNSRFRSECSVNGVFSKVKIRNFKTDLKNIIFS